MTAYSAEAWGDFALAVAGAAAALTGLLFVAVSLNLDQILAYPHLPGRAATTLGALGTLLLVSLCMLAPAQGRLWLGGEVAAVAALLAAAVVRTQMHARRIPNSPEHLVTASVVLLVPAALLLVGGVSVAIGAGGGLYWVFAGTATGFAGTLLNAWVLLVEIKR